jgi:hypothetical protein
MYKLRDWVDEFRLQCTLSCNERAVEYLENHEHLIDENYILYNENAIHIIEKIIGCETFVVVNHNKNAVNFLRNNRQYIRYEILCGEEHGIEFVDELIKNNELDKIDWSALSKNPAAMHILNDPKYYDMINWYKILYNKNAAELVKNNLHKIGKYWFVICGQPHLIDIVEQNMDKIYWNALSGNCNAIHILEKYMDKIHIIHLRYNKNGFKLLLQLGYVFTNEQTYHINIILEYLDYCEKNNIPFNLIDNEITCKFDDVHFVLKYFDYCERNNEPFKLINFLSKYGYTEKHMDFLKRNNHYWYLSMNPNIFEYDYKRMHEIRQSLLWYNDIKK